MTSEEQGVFYAGAWRSGPLQKFYKSLSLVRSCGCTEIWKVRLVEDERDGTHWGFLRTGASDYCMIYASLPQLRICFPYGLEVAEGRGEGRRVRLQVVKIERIA